MPESPEVQALADFLGERIVGGRLRSYDLDEARALATRDRPPTTLTGARIDGVVRFGKHLAVASEAGYLVVSFGRAGWARWNGEEAPGAAPVIARLGIDDDLIELTDAGQWLSISLAVVDEPRDVSSIAKLGPDPTDAAFTRSAFDALVGRRKQVKALLQEQESLAGIGNAYSDEILHTARISPVAHASALGAEARESLFAATTEVLHAAMDERRGIPPHELKAAKVAAMHVHGRGGQACPRCGGTILDRSSGSASSQYCPICQTGGVVL